MRLFLARGVYATAIDDDLVFLDPSADAYFCLAGGRAALRLSPDRVVEAAQASVAAQMVEAGLLAERGEPEIDASVAAPLQALDPGRRAGRALGRWTLQAVASNLHSARAVERLDLAGLIEAARRRDAVVPAPAAPLVDEVAAFRGVSPWLPRGGVCLMRSFQLLTHLRRRGHDANWVFGVRTWPFEAHCWLQAGDLLLDDTLERIGAFKPILVV